jgi:hypothetical protein
LNRLRSFGDATCARISVRNTPHPKLVERIVKVIGCVRAPFLQRQSIIEPTRWGISGDAALGIEKGQRVSYFAFERRLTAAQGFDFQLPHVATRRGYFLESLQMAPAMLKAAGSIMQGVRACGRSTLLTTKALSCPRRDDRSH